MPVTGGRALRLGAYASIWLIWGSTYLAIKWAVETVPPFLTVAIRSLAAGIILVAWARLREDQAPTRAQWIAAIGAGALYFLLGHGGLFWAEQRVATGPAALMIATEHFWVVLIAWMLPGGQRPSRRAATGIAIGLVGVGLLTLAGGGEGGIDPLGAVVLLGASAAWAGGSIYFAGERRPAPPLYASGMPLVMGGVLLLGASAAVGETARVTAADFTPVAIGSLAYLIIFGSVVAFTAFTWLVQTDGPSRAGSYAYVNPFVAVLLGWALADEALTPRMLAAGAAIVLAVVLIVRGTRVQAPSQPPAPATPRRGSSALREREA
ncbi:EamA family transporter [Longimicrobium sp.]|uniref:EamA family transporter n=1 Tax=Longimicrobium sp. TaxID=2029185 RepID=UPI002E326123|nr:EamA family transporter [Longimicrobium sp.]HEX6041667.1 EamA family transporter [Longimicrobium sp.]